VFYASALHLKATTYPWIEHRFFSSFRLPADHRFQQISQSFHPVQMKSFLPRLVKFKTNIEVLPAYVLGHNHPYAQRCASASHEARCSPRTFPRPAQIRYRHSMIVVPFSRQPAQSCHESMRKLMLDCPRFLLVGADRSQSVEVDDERQRFQDLE
jgi:hypothetical protein